MAVSSFCALAITASLFTAMAWSTAHAQSQGGVLSGDHSVSIGADGRIIVVPGTGDGPPRDFMPPAPGAEGGQRDGELNVSGISDAAEVNSAAVKVQAVDLTSAERGGAHACANIGQIGGDVCGEKGK